MKMFKTGLCAVATACFFVQDLSAAPRLTVMGTVTDVETGKPIAGARISDDDYGPKPYKGATTDAAGNYQYETWSEEHNVVARAAGYNTQQQLLTATLLQQQEEKGLNFKLTPRKEYATPVSVLLEQGIYTEETVGDLGRAIEIYAQIIEDEQANRKYVAEALFRLGRCFAKEQREAEALAALEKLSVQYGDQKQLVEKARAIINRFSPDPLFPEIDGCRLVYTVPFHLEDSAKTYNGGKFSFYQTDKVVIDTEVDPSLEDGIDRFEFVKISIKEGREQDTYPVQHFPGTIRSMPAQSMEGENPGLYRCRLVGYRGEDVVTQYECLLEIKATMYSQLGLNEIQPDGDIRFSSAQQTPEVQTKTTTRGFINSDFVHIENMFDAEGNEVEFTEKHEGSIYRYRATLNEPVHKGETLLLGDKGWKEGMIREVPGSKDEYSYRMNHTPGVSASTRRMEIFRLPKGAVLLETTPTDLPSRILEDGRVEILVDTIIPTGGSLRTEFRYRLSTEPDKYVAQIAVLKTDALSKEQREALDRIEAITAQATFHNGALVQLAKLVPTAKHNHQRIVKAAELASQFGYHTGALIKVAEIAAEADRECAELDDVLELVVLKLGGTPLVINVARDAVNAESETEQTKVLETIATMRASADYQTLAEALEGQKDLLDAPTNHPQLELQPAPWINGEVLRYRLLTKTGMEMGSLFWAVNGMELKGRDCWKMEQRLVIPSSGTIMASHVIAEKENFIPISGRTTHQLGTVDATYLPGKVLLQHKGAGAPREIKVPEPIFDNEQVIFLIRRLPLTEKYNTSFPIMSVLSGASGLECRIRVMDREDMEVASGSYDCWEIRIQVYMGGMKAVEQTAWFTVEGRVPVKFVTDQMDMELAEQTSASQKSMELKEHGASVQLPGGWFGYELPAKGKDSEIVRLLPPDMKLEAMLCKTVRQPAAISVEEIAAKDIELLKGYFKDYTIHEDTVTEKEVAGKPVYIYAADYEDQGQAKMEYRAYYVAGSRVFWFVFRMERDQFDEEKASLDELIEGLMVQQ